MKKTAISILVILISVLSIQAQSYDLKMMNGNFNCYLDLFPDSTYIIKLSTKNTPDLVMSQLFSFGKYSVNKQGVYQLKDRTNEYVMTLETASESTKDKVLFVKNSFGWMQNNYFVKQSAKPLSPASITKDFLKRNELVNYREKQRVPFSQKACAFVNGTYKSTSNPDYRFTINRSDSTYAINLGSLRLSKGKLAQEDNFIVLKDTFSDTPFYVLPDENGMLRSMLMPGDFYLSKFELVKN